MRRLNNEETYPQNLILEILDHEEHDGVINEDMTNGLDFIFKNLDECEQNIILLRYRDRYTYDQIGKVLSVTKGRAREKILCSLRKLRQPKNRKYVKHGLEFVTISEQNESQRIERVLSAKKNNARELLITDLDEISIRTHNALYRKGLNTLGKIIDFKEKKGDTWYRLIPNLGIKSMTEIENVLRIYTQNI